MKLLRRKDPMRAPVVPWHFRDSVTGFEFSEKYETREQLVAHIIRYRDMNRLEPMEHIEEILEDFICRQPGMDTYVEEYEIPDTERRSLAQYLSGAAAFVRTAKKRFSREESLVSQEKADSRALTCLNCPHNAPTPNKTGMEQMTDNWMMTLTKESSTRYDGALKECQKCGGCPLKAKVWIAPDVLDATTSQGTQEKLKEPIIGHNGNRFLCWARLGA